MCIGLNSQQLQVVPYDAVFVAIMMDPFCATFLDFNFRDLSLLPWFILHGILHFSEQEDSRRLSCD